MRTIPLWKIVVIALSLIFTVFYLYPTARLGLMSQRARAALPPEQRARLEDKAINLGLDLKGGMYLLLEVDKSGLKEDEARDAVDRALEIIRNRVDQFGVAEPSIQRQGTDRILVQLPGLQDVDRAKKLIGQTALLEFRMVEEGLPQLLKDLDARVPARLRLGEEETAAAPAGAAGDSAMVAAGSQTEPILAPIDTAATEEPALESLSSMVSFFGQRPDEPGVVAEEEVPIVERFLAAPEVQAAIPADRIIAWGSGFEQGRQGRFKYLYLLRGKADLTGAKISTAAVRPDPDRPGTYEVSVKFTAEGSRAFHRLTRKNVGRLLAIALDGKVNSAPEIRTAIPGIASITGSFGIEEARDLGIVLRAGKLPAPLRIIEERSVGPSLGQDSIRMGVRASVVGAIAVCVFMIVYYNLSGVIANVALALNTLLLLAVMKVIGTTLTLPGIAGIALTIGMAVDANVLIYERIREELRQGKSVRAAIEKGYERATVTIIDSNVTTILTTVALLYFGTASVKGFAVTLTIGLIINLFTAIMVTHLIYDWMTSRWKMERLSI